MGAKRHLNGTSQEGIDRQTDRHTHGHCDSMTESAQWANSVKIYFNLNPLIQTLKSPKLCFCHFKRDFEHELIPYIKRS